MIMQANSREDVVEHLKDDIYHKQGVWDVENAVIIPMKLSIFRPGIAESFERSESGTNYLEPEGLGLGYSPK